MDTVHVKGQNRGNLVLYALSTCGWCKKTKDFLASHGVEYDYVYVDLERGQERSKAINEVKRFNPACSFPTLVINDEKCIVGFKEDEIKKALGLY